MSVISKYFDSFEVNEAVILDANTTCEQQVKVSYQSKLLLMTEVTNGKATWTVMTNRLTKINKK